MDAAKVVAELRTHFEEGVMRDLEERRKALLGLRNMLVENEDAICEALHKDLRKPKAEAIAYETLFTINEVTHTIDHLKSWMKPERVTRNLLQAVDGAYVHKDPLGVALIIGAWNFPIQLLLCPLIGALAAGNCVVLKPSEVASATEKIIVELVPKYISEKVVRVVCGAAEETTELLKNKFDHIFYTGSTAVGRLVMLAAADKLTPVTLELGGKCPVIVDEGVDLSIAAKRIMWGKLVNGGQICVAADYVLCVNKNREEFVEKCKSAVEELYGSDPSKSPDYCKIINKRHFDRLTKVLEATKGKKVLEGPSNAEELYISPTVLTDIKEDDELMKDEIFGPILPIIDCGSIDEAIAFVNKRPKPLTLYMFSEHQKNIDRVLKSTSSGNVTVNDIMMNMCLESLPFGGVGASGIGRYHGKYSFDTFTHEKAVLHRSSGWESFLWMRYPPYNDNKLSWARRAVAKFRLPF
ncbi:hypothetical protein QR680_006158 [Steinernema hermaphroditum]|uniref:Aldehyde dehydrogenase n=1 Tax=Steinernema hermaphroditum TaxID=289476 RepID=A0AA39HWX7_9BILA|nr:hypothetical protein QR680_006158 [Steinernema hermaphroditum]